MANRICTTMAAWWHICHSPTAVAMATSSGVPRTKRKPAFRSRQKCASFVVTGASCTRTPRRISTDPSSISASSSRATGAPATLIRAPAKPGPATSAPELASALRACASTSRSRGTTCVSTICAAEPATT